MQAHMMNIKLTQTLFPVCLRTKDTQSLGDSSEIPAFQSAHPGQSRSFCLQQLRRQSCSWKSYVTWMISLLPLLWHFLVATQSQTVCVFKANIDRASFQDFVKPLEAGKERVIRKTNWSIRGCEAQPGGGGGGSECPWIVTFGYTELCGSSVFVAFSNFLAQRLCAFLFPGVPPSRPGWERSQQRAEVWGLLKWFSF